MSSIRMQRFLVILDELHVLFSNFPGEFLEVVDHRGVSTIFRSPFTTAVSFPITASEVCESAFFCFFANRLKCPDLSGNIL